MECPRCKSNVFSNGQIIHMEFYPESGGRNFWGQRKRISFLEASLCLNCGLLSNIRADMDDIKRNIKVE